MSFSATLQRRANPVQVVKRHVSSKPRKVASHRTLPTPKMRALISLYHQAETFVTPENLSQRIDEAFFPHDYTQIRTTVHLKDLSNALTEQRAAPKISEWDLEATRSVAEGVEDGTWSSIKAARELKVIEALYGVEAKKSILPGLEVLEESAGDIQRILRQELEEASEYADYPTPDKRS